MHERANRRNKILRHAGALSLLLALGQPSAALAQANEETGRSYAYGNLSVVDGDVWHQRADDFGAHEAERGSPFLPGDRIWTREPGQVELRFAGGVTAWMDEGTKLDYVEGDSPHRLGFWIGSLIVWMASDTEVVVETPGGTFSPQGEGEYRTDLLEDGRTVQFVVYSGIATVSTEWGSVLVGAGQRTFASEGAAPASPEEYLGNDNFFAWTEDRQRRFVTTAETHYDELPEEVREYAHDLDGHGRWQQDGHLGWLWYPTVSAGWAPYRQGRWAHTPFGLTWVSSDPWGWAPYHYGRWGHGPLGWYWLPGSVWGPGWVSWSYGYNWVGWSPLNYYGYPVYDYYGYGYSGYGYSGYGYSGYEGSERAYGGRGVRRGTILGKAVPRGSVADRGSWSFTAREVIGQPASRNRLSASSLRNLEDAQVLSRGAILDRGFRQRAVGVTAMTRSAKSTNRRLSNSRVATTRAAAAAGRAAVGADRSTLRGQRVAIPSSAARARSTRSTYAAERDRATLAREAAGRSGTARGAEANRSRATAQGRGTAGPSTAGRRTGRPEAARGREGSAGNRPATSPRPRAAGRTGATGTRRPSAVRPASPRSGAASAGSSGTPRSRPNSGAVRNRPSGASRSQPSSGASRSRPSGASRSQPSSGASRSRPSGASRSQPSSGASRSRPSGASRSQPSSGASRSRPSGASRSQPSSGASRSRPSGASRSQPSSGASRSRPSSGAVRSRPSGASRSRPSAASRSRPSSASRSRPGGFSRFAGSGQSGASRGGGGGGGGSSASGGGSSAAGGGGGSTAVSRGGSSSSGSRRPNNN